MKTPRSTSSKPSNNDFAAECAGEPMPAAAQGGKRVLVIGSSNTDMIIKVPRVPRPGETILGGKFTTAAGGKGANQAVAAARAGAAVTFIARVGKDAFGDQARAGFMADGIETRFVITDPGQPSGVALILVGDDGENSIAVASGANNALAPADLQLAGDAFQDARIVLLQLETPLETVQAAVDAAEAAGVPVILNPAPAQPLPAALLKKLYLLTPNESEAEALSGVPVSNMASAARAAEKLLRRGVQNVIITLGARGVFVASRELRQHIPGCKVAAVDTTGAGDVFNGTLAVGLSEGRPLLEAAEFACAAAAISVTRLGAQTSAPTRAEIQRMLSSAGVTADESARGANGRDNGWSQHPGSNGVAQGRAWTPPRRKAASAAGV